MEGSKLGRRARMHGKLSEVLSFQDHEGGMEGHVTTESSSRTLESCLGT